MPETDWQEVLVDIGEQITAELKSEHSTKASNAQDLECSVVRDATVDVPAAITKFKQSKAKIERLCSSLSLISGHLNRPYRHPK